MTPHFRRSVVAVLCSWVLAAHVYRDFQPVRAKQVRVPMEAQQSVSVTLTGVEQITQPTVVIIARFSNPGSEPVTALASVDQDFIRKVELPPKSSQRVDLLWTSQRRSSPPHRLIVVGSAPWSLDYLEIANLHGFTRGIVTFLVLPASQPFAGFPLWSIAICIGWAALMSRTGRPPVWPRRLQAAYVAISASVAFLFALIAVSNLVSSYRIVLPLQTLAIGILILSLPEIHGMVMRAVPDTIVRRAATFPWFSAVLTAGFAAFAILLISHVGAFAGGSDSSGYLNNARLIGGGHVTTPIRRTASFSEEIAPEHTFVPLGFRSVSTSAMVPTYPIGLPIAVAAVARVIGWAQAPNATMVLHALAGVALMFWLALSCGLSRCWSAIAALLLASSPLYLFSSLQFMSDVPALVWCTLAVTIAWRERLSAGRGLALAGLVLSFAVLVRPTNVLAVVPVAVCLGLSLRRWVWLAVGALPGAILFLGYNLSAYGSPLTTGYGNISSEFAAAFGLPTVRYYIAWLPFLLTPFCILALGLPVLWRRTTAIALMLSSWIVAITGVYAFYAHTGEMWSSLRFLLPAFPPLIVASLLVAREIVSRWSWRLRFDRSNRRAWATALAAILILSYNNFWSRRLGVLDVGQGDLVALQSADWAKAHLPRDATIFAMQLSGALFYYTDFPVLRYDDFTPDGLRRVQSTAIAQRLPLYAVIMSFEQERLLTPQESDTGAWRTMGNVKDVTILAWEPRAGGGTAIGSAQERR